MFEEDGKLWFCTSNQKEVYRKLKKHPYVELCTTSKNMSWLRLQGKAVFEDNFEIEEKVLSSNPLVKEIFQAADNPSFSVFYLEEVSASISEIGKPTRSF